MSASASDQLAWEARAGRLAAAAAALSGLLFVVGSVYFNTTVRERPTGVDQELLLLQRESANLLVSGFLVALAFLLLGGVLFYLYRVTKHRRPELPAAALPLLVFGAVIASASEVTREFAVLDVASRFLASGPRTAAHAQDLLRASTGLQVVGVAGLAANFALGLTLGLVCINAMRAGLLSRFMGVYGLVLGVLTAIAPAQLRGVVFLLLFFWLLALAALFLDRWPGGRGAAWDRGEAAPWPSVADRDAELQRQREAIDSDAVGSGVDLERERPVSEDPDTPLTGAAATEAAGGSSAARRSKRKRGRRS